MESGLGLTPDAEGAEAVVLGGGELADAPFFDGRNRLEDARRRTDFVAVLRGGRREFYLNGAIADLADGQIDGDAAELQGGGP